MQHKISSHRKGQAHGKGRNYTNISEMADDLWRLGAFHTILAAPKAAYA